MRMKANVGEQALKDVHMAYDDAEDNLLSLFEWDNCEARRDAELVVPLAEILRPSKKGKGKSRVYLPLVLYITLTPSISSAADDCSPCPADRTSRR